MLALAVAIAFSGYLSAKEAIVEVAAGRHDRNGTVVSVALPGPLSHAPRHSVLCLDDDSLRTAQVYSDGRPRIMWKLKRPLKAGKTRRFRISPGVRTPAKIRVRCEDDGKRLVIKVSDKPVLVYNHALVIPPKGVKPSYARSGYIHPLYNPTGQVVTDDMSPDHPHQHGVMFPWKYVISKGVEANFWEHNRGPATIEHIRMSRTDDGAISARIEAELRYVYKKETWINETWIVRVFDFDEYFVIDLESTQQPTRPLTVRKNHYGGMAIRAHRGWKQDGGGMLTSEGKSRAEGNHSRPRWVDIFGNIDGKATGVTIMCHPENFRYPQHVRLHPKMPYFCFAPMVPGSFELKPGKPFVSRYRFFVHNGKVDVEQVERLWRDYAQPPVVKVVKVN